MITDICSALSKSGVPFRSLRKLTEMNAADLAGFGHTNTYKVRVSGLTTPRDLAGLLDMIPRLETRYTQRLFTVDNPAHVGIPWVGIGEGSEMLPQMPAPFITADYTIGDVQEDSDSPVPLAMLWRAHLSLHGRFVATIAGCSKTLVMQAVESLRTTNG